MIPTHEDLQEWGQNNGCSGMSDEDILREWHLSHYVKCEDHYI